MGARQYNSRMRQNRNANLYQGSAGIPARNAQLAETAYDVGNYTAEQQAQMNKNALNCDRLYFYYFRRRWSGRLCSCMLGDENTPNSTCLICFNTGFVGGFDKYGTHTEVLDITHPALVFTNVRGNYDEKSKTTYFILDPDARYGMIQGTIQIKKTNFNYVDALQTYDNGTTLDGDGSIVYMCREYGSNIWLPLTTANVQTILNTTSATQMEFAIYLRRRSLNVRHQPRFSHIYLRYGLLPEDRSVIHADIPRNINSITLQEWGWEEQMGTIQMFMDNTITTYSIEDFFWYKNKNRFWHVSEVQEFKAFDIVTSSDLTARFMQRFEIATQIPI